MSCGLAAAVVDRHGVAELAAAMPAQADLFTPANRRWCALTAIGLNDCSYDTFAQCMATLSGIGGSCSIEICRRRNIPTIRRRARKRRA